MTNKPIFIPGADGNLLIRPESINAVSIVNYDEDATLEIYFSGTKRIFGESKERIENLFKVIKGAMEND
jgi:hypothetical protein